MGLLVSKLWIVLHFNFSQYTEAIETYLDEYAIAHK